MHFLEKVHVKHAMWKHNPVSQFGKNFFGVIVLDYCFILFLTSWTFFFPFFSQEIVCGGTNFCTEVRVVL